MIIATAGHVDHGKTSLIKALSGTDTDRLPEEKKRGLTIDIGFAYMAAGDGRQIALIDVPGHEKFVRNMIAGVGMVDIALLVIAADDGPMPQTLEHISILKLMDVRLVVPVITKTDLVDSVRVEEVVQAMQSILTTADIASTEFFYSSATDRSVVQQLKTTLLDSLSSLPPRVFSGHFRMAIDRCFTLDGSGTVVTGTVASGLIEKNQSVILQSNNPSNGKSSRVRGLHAQNSEATTATAGQRCALNLSGELVRADLHRGGWLVANSLSIQTSIVDVSVTPSIDFGEKESDRQRSLQHWTPAHLHIGTADVPCRVALLDCTEAGSGDIALARLICERKFTAAHGDRFVLRDQSARKTIAGGRVLDALPPKRGRSKPERLALLQAMNVAEPVNALSSLLELNNYGIDLDAFARLFNLLPAQINELVASDELTGIQTGSSYWCLKVTQSTRLQEQVLAVLQQYHVEHPEQFGIDLPAIRRAIAKELHAELLEHHLQSLIDNAKVVRSAAVYRHADHEIAMTQADSQVWSRVEEELAKAGRTPLRVTEFAAILENTTEQTQQFLNLCVAHGKIFKVTDNRYFLPETLRDLAVIAEALAAADNLTVGEFRNSSGIGRNLVVELLEYFDRCRFTQRIGNKRRVLRSASAIF